jgi:hypothetical protein
MDKPGRKALLRAWREQHRESARAALPLPDVEMEALFDALDHGLHKGGCDHTRRLTDAWLTERGHSLGRIHRWLDNHGGFCDCEVLGNGEDAWRTATGRR